MSNELGLSRDFTVAVFVVNQNRVLLQYHQQLDRWLPPGGHVEPNELPDQAAVREVLEETGVRAKLVCDNVIEIDFPHQPRQLCRPVGIQLATIRPDHEHIDLVYLATGEVEPNVDRVGWFTAEEWGPLGLTEEVEAWCVLALNRLKHFD